MIFRVMAMVALMGVAACSSNSKETRKAAREANPAPCPNIVVLEDAARLVEFDGGGERLANVAYSAEIVDVSLACRYFAEEPIDISVDIDLAFGLGPASQTTVKEYKYFVAVTRTNLEVIAKREFTVPVDFGDKDRIKRVEEEIDKITIPRAGEQTSGENFEVIVGFVVTPAQAIYNRSGKSLKFPDL